MRNGFRSILLVVLALSSAAFAAVEREPFTQERFEALQAEDALILLPKLRTRGWLAVESALCLLVLPALFSLRTVQQSRDNVMYLADDDLPLLVSIQRLNVQMLKVQTILYNYYLTADSALFMEQFPPGYDALPNTYLAIEPISSRVISRTGTAPT